METRVNLLWRACLRTLNKARLLLSVLPRLGLANVASVAGYRLALASGLIEKVMSVGNEYHDPLFHDSGHLTIDLSCHVSESGVVDLAKDQLKGNITYFSVHKYNVGSPPDWFLNPVNQKRHINTDLHWSRLPDFSRETGDVKIIWEASRFDWALVFARAYLVSGDENFLLALNKWATDWVTKNPLNRGPNWKCGQEAAIRMLQTLLAAFLVNQHKSPTAGLVRFVFEHCRRISLTMPYAIAQDNNHGVSEAAGLFIGGAWLKMVSDDPNVLRNAGRWVRKGLILLEDRVDRLIEKDGSFSQYSTNYHRLALDTLSMVEFWRRNFDRPSFSAEFYEKVRAATNWLFQMTDPVSGDAPNLGANDGARIFNLSSADFRDYRPTAQLSSRLFYGKPAYPRGEYDGALHWLGIEANEQDYNIRPIPKESTLFEQGGYCYLVNSGLEVFIRFPKFKFRPGHADALHLDLWYKGLNVIRDAGTYSYNTVEPWLSYFPGTRAHSTVEFDDRDQMPRISRFLFGSWLKTCNLSSIKKIDGKLSWSAGYEDYKGAKHNREVFLADGKVTIQDTVKGFRNRAVIRWRLAPISWSLNAAGCSSNIGAFRVTATVPIRRSELVEGFESRYYLRKISVPVFEVELDKDAVVATEVVLCL